MAGQSSKLTTNEVSKTIKSLENNSQTNSNGANSGAETNQQVNRKGTKQPLCY
jgi:hypothetical protein